MTLRGFVTKTAYGEPFTRVPNWIIPDAQLPNRLIAAFLSTRESDRKTSMWPVVNDDGPTDGLHRGLRAPGRE